MKAAITMNEACARLTMPMTPKISVRPDAISAIDAAEQEPEDDDLDRSGHARPSFARAPLAEIELLDARVAEDRLRRPLEGGRAEIEHAAPVGEIEAHAGRSARRR